MPLLPLLTLATLPACVHDKPADSAATGDTRDDSDARTDSTTNSGSDTTPDSGSDTTPDSGSDTVPDSRPDSDSGPDTGDPPLAVTIWGAGEGLPPGTWNGLSAAGGVVWIASGNGLIRLDGADGAIRTYTAADGLLLDAAQSALIHSDGTLWVGHAADAVQQGTQFQINADLSLTALRPIDYWETTEITGLYRMREQPYGPGAGDVWMGTNEGACLYDADLQVFQEHAHPTHPHELSLGVAFTPEGHVWNLDQYQLSRWNYSNDGDLSTSADLAEFWIPCQIPAGTPILGRDLDSDGDTLWLATEGCGVVQILTGATVGTSTTRALGLPFPTAARAIRVDGQGNVWIGAQDGLYVYDARADRLAPVPLPLAPPIVQLTVDAARAEVWAAGADGVARITGLPADGWIADATPPLP